MVFWQIGTRCPSIRDICPRFARIGEPREPSSREAVEAFISKLKGLGRPHWTPREKVEAVYYLYRSLKVYLGRMKRPQKALCGDAWERSGRAGDGKRGTAGGRRADGGRWTAERTNNEGTSSQDDPRQWRMLGSKCKWHESRGVPPVERQRKISLCFLAPSGARRSTGQGLSCKTIPSMQTI